MPKYCFVAGCKTGYVEDRINKKESGEKIHSLFMVPKDPVLLALWQKAVPYVGKKLRPIIHFICEIHFRKEDVDGTYKYLLWDIRKIRSALKPGAIPCYFPDLPGYTSPNRKKYTRRKSSPKEKKGKHQKKTQIDGFIGKVSEETKEVFLTPTKKKKFIPNILSYRSPIIQKCIVAQSELVTSAKTQSPGEETLVQPPQSVPGDNSSSVSEAFSLLNDNQDNLSTSSQVNPMNTSTEPAQVISNKENSGEPQLISTEINSEDNSSDKPEGVLPQSVLEEQFSFNFIKVNINMLEKQNSTWSFIVFDTFIICAYWNSNYGIERKIVIKDDLTVKVFLKERLTTMGKDLKLESLETISKLIYRVERSIICPEIYNNEGKCHGFLQGTFICKKKNMCEGCIKWEKDKVKEEKQRLLEEKKIAQKQVELIRFHFSI